LDVGPEGKEGLVTADVYGFLTTEPNAVVAPIHPKAMPGS
jgi:putative SOS response-associated peptidase YedK